MRDRALPKPSVERRAWLIIGLLFLVQVVNFFDKAVLSLAAGPIMREFDLTTAQYGAIAGSFFSLYAVGGLLVGFLAAPRFRPRVIVTALLIAWSAAQLPIILVASYPMLIAGRALLGLSEGGGTPSALNAGLEWFEDDARNMPSAVILFGSTAGSLLAAPILTGIIQAFGWRAAFVACGLLGVALLVPWLLLGRDGPHGAAAPTAEAAEIAIRPGRLWSDPTIAGNVVVGAATYWLAAFMIGFLAPYLATLVADPVLIGWTLSAIYGWQACCVLLISFLSQRLLMRGASSRTARGRIMGACLIGSALAFLAIPLAGSVPAKLALVALALGLPGAVFPLSAAMISEVAPPAQRNGVLTITFSVVTLAALPSSISTGRLVDASRSGWDQALLLCGAVALVGGAVAFLALDPKRTAARFASTRCIRT